MASSNTTPASPPRADESFTAMDDKDATLIGQHCEFAFCHQLDFLPFRCESCRHTFCLDHRSETTHRCTHAGEWAARRRRAQLARPSLGAGTGQSLLPAGSDRAERPCASPSCKTPVNRGLSTGVHCTACNRTYCLKHRMKEDHDCKNLVPVGPASRPATATALDAAAARAEQARAALSRFKIWGASQKASVASRAVPPSSKSKPTSSSSSSSSASSTAASRLAALNALKRTAKGDARLPAEQRVYVHVEAEAATTTARYPRGDFFYARDWALGRVLDAAARSLQVENVNNQGTGEAERLRVFHVEGGRLLDFGERAGAALASGNTIVLLRGVGPAVPDLVEV